MSSSKLAQVRGQGHFLSGGAGDGKRPHRCHERRKKERERGDRDRRGRDARFRHLSSQKCESCPASSSSVAIFHSLGRGEMKICHWRRFGWPQHDGRRFYSGEKQCNERSGRHNDRQRNGRRGDKKKGLAGSLPLPLDPRTSVFSFSAFLPSFLPSFFLPIADVISAKRVRGARMPTAEPPRRRPTK